MKYPRTPHAPSSASRDKDDLVMSQSDFDKLSSGDCIITEKLDGECASLLHDRCHARSEDSPHHASRDWLKGFHANLAYRIPRNLQIVGEYLYAIHSIEYTNLASYFYVFAMIDLDQKIFLSWDETKLRAWNLGLPLVPVFGTNQFYYPTAHGSMLGGELEGLVIRNRNAFPISEFASNCAKIVRANHVKTDDTWKTNWRKHTLKGK